MVSCSVFFASFPDSGNLCESLRIANEWQLPSFHRWVDYAVIKHSKCAFQSSPYNLRTGQAYLDSVDFLACSCLFNMTETRRICVRIWGTFSRIDTLLQCKHLSKWISADQLAELIQELLKQATGNSKSVKSSTATFARQDGFGR